MLKTKRCLLPGRALRRGGDSQGSTGRPDAPHPRRWGSWVKWVSPRRRLSDFSWRRHLARRFWNHTWKKGGAGRVVRVSQLIGLQGN